MKKLTQLLRELAGAPNLCSAIVAVAAIVVAALSVCAVVLVVAMLL